ncbi:MAG: polysaccharide biosynthesis protein [Bacillus sp. (in: Bacteria)]|nr:polysaccharide biosynthesis protein [Bacillus sp. (in: firmicutes)]MCM1425485.1 polysaccharide biosynthesis protein [Eubacterium sp.]
MGRVKQAEKNIFFGYISNIVILLLGFWQNRIFIRVLGGTLLGVNGLYTTILGMLSLAELGIGTALNYSLYKPVAEHNEEKIKSFMRLYKKAYTIIAVVIAVIGLLLTPFLPYLITAEKRGDISIRDLTIYYLIFLFNTVSTYFVAYKYSLVNAEQRNYIQTTITTLTKIVTVAAQIVILFTTQNFLFYLLTQAAVELIQKIAVSIYFNRLYPYLRDKDVKKLEKVETDTVVQKTKAMMLHKIGDVARLSTDDIIITYYLDLNWVGIVHNYNYVITYAANFINVIFNSIVSGFGNLVATESKEKQYGVFKIYRFVACWLYGFAAVGFWLLLTPFVTGIWLDESWKLGQTVLTLILIDLYLKGGRTVLVNFKIAAGVVEKDRYLALIQGGVNLLISIVGIKWIGLAGVYVGTVVSGILANLIQPVIIYHDCFSQSVRHYFKDSFKYIAAILGIVIILIPVKNMVLKQMSLPAFILMAVIITIVYNMVFMCLFRKTDEFLYLQNWITGKLKRTGKQRG